jgi:hypothetical protein
MAALMKILCKNMLQFIGIWGLRPEGLHVFMTRVLDLNGPAPRGRSFFALHLIKPYASVCQLVVHPHPPFGAVPSPSAVADLPAVLLQGAPRGFCYLLIS